MAADVAAWETDGDLEADEPVGSSAGAVAATHDRVFLQPMSQALPGLDGLFPRDRLNVCYGANDECRPHASAGAFTSGDDEKR